MRAGWAAAIVLTVSTAQAAPKKQEAAPALPPPPLVLTVTPGAAGSPWRMKIDNPGELPIRIPADERLLALEITGQDKKVVRCALPDDARPATDEGRELVIPGKRSWSANVDPIFLCFGAKERAALAAGASVKAIFGWPSKAKNPAPPFAATPVGAAIGVDAPAKTIESAPFALAGAVPALPGGSTAAGEGEGGKNALVLSMPDAEDVARGAEIGATVTAANTSERAITLLFRSEVLEFRVTGPGGTITCGTPRSIDSPIRELFTTIPAKGRTSMTPLITSMCPPDTFDEPGVYRVFVKIDTTGASGREIGLRTWDGTAESTTPMLLRVRTARRPQPPERAKLDGPS
ncbi:MAG TPA: hypothetical protein VIF62_19115 [Labilithrix sp.]